MPPKECFFLDSFFVANRMSAATRMQIERQSEELRKGLFACENVASLDTHE
jgi:hypothetical protein